jgi:2-C-methyl-D-erythritol 4-phosphate cytidylyltransferase
VSRKDIVIVQTPQVFRTELIREAYMQDYSEEFTMMQRFLKNRAERSGWLREKGEYKDYKPEDLLIASTLLPKIT